MNGAAPNPSSSEKNKLRLNSNLTKFDLLSDLLLCNLPCQMDHDSLADPNKNNDILHNQIQALKNKRPPHQYINVG